MDFEQLGLWKKEKSTDWKWTMANDYPKQTNGLKVFSCFACGGGSTMGYKLAGCEMLGCCEIDPRMNKVYVANHHPKYNYLEDIRDFNKRTDLPDELYHLDILDGSPPCSTFSMAGQREDAWGKQKKFREGQKKQTLDDLLFVFIDTGATNRKLGSDMAGSVTGGGLHGKDLSKADVAVNIYAFLKAQKTGKPVELSCAIGDTKIDRKPYSEIVKIARKYINQIGGFEKFAEWGLF